MREKLLRIAKRIEAVENECNVDLMRPREILRAVREAIEEEVAADPPVMYTCVHCEAKISSDRSVLEHHEVWCAARS